MRISDWSSDVCASDLRRAGQRQVGIAEPGRPHRRRLVEAGRLLVGRQVDDVADARLTQTLDVGGHKPARRNDAGRRGGRVGDLRHAEIGRAHVRTPVTNAHIVSRLLLKKKTTTSHWQTHRSTYQNYQYRL